MTDTTGTVRLHRVLRAPRSKVYRAFLEPAAMCKWLPPYGFVANVEHMDAREGGSFRMSFTNFGTGKAQSFGGEYIELAQDTLIRYTDRFDDPNLPGTIEVRVELRDVLCGTEVSIVQSGIPAAIPVEFCYLGWQESLEQLARLTEPNIPDA